MVVGRRFFLPECLRHDAEHRAAVEVEEAVRDGDDVDVAETDGFGQLGRGPAPGLVEGACHRHLLELHEHPLSARGVDERHGGALGAGPGFFVDEADVALPQFGQRRTNVVDPQRDVMQSRTARLEKFRNRRIRRGRLQQLERRRPRGHELRADALRGHVFSRPDVQPQRIAKERQRRLQVLHRDADMIQDRFHDYALSTSSAAA